MRYNEENNEIELSARELVAIARRGVGAATQDTDEPIFGEEINTERVYYPFESCGYKFLLTARIQSVEAECVTLRVLTDSAPERPRKEIIAQARGEGYIAALVIAESYGYKMLRVRYIYENKITHDEHEVEEWVSRKKLDSFIEKCLVSIKVYAKPEIERVTKRIPSMQNVKFPYQNVRSGQEEIMSAVFRNVTRGGVLFTAAPTGTGKTISMLYPAVKAMGKGKCDKIFYLTPKTTTANAAKDCIELLKDTGADLRGIVIPAKARACIGGGVCKTSRDLCKNSPCKLLANALIDLYSRNITVVTDRDLKEVGEKHSVCPHELALTYAEIADVVILDINYLFDPRVYIRRFFEEGGKYAFLVDEAHNLPDRAREMYSAEISTEFLSSIAENPMIGEHSKLKNVTRVATERFSEILMPYVREEMYTDEDGKKQGAMHLSDVPGDLYPLFDELIGNVEAEIFKSYAATDDEATARTNLLREYYYTLRSWREAMEEFDSGYEFFIFREGEALRAKCFCIDPSKRIAKRLEKGQSTTFFSGTLSPMYYYKAVLGGDGSSEMMEVDSPFDESQLSVSIMDKISTRSSERENTLNAVCRVIAATVSAKRGNYMVFTPSFKYSESLASLFRAKYPKIKTLLQRQNMSTAEKADFISEFEKESDSYLIGFCVMGGIYSEGIDLAGDSLIGAVIVGIGIPALSYEREAISAYYNDKYEEGAQFAYVYPGVNRVLQAAGRVIRREDDRGVIVLVDDRFDDPIYKTVIPKLWSGMKYISDAKELRDELDKFWLDGKDKK